MRDDSVIMVDFLQLQMTSQACSNIRENKAETRWQPADINVTSQVCNLNGNFDHIREQKKSKIVSESLSDQ